MWNVSQDLATPAQQQLCSDGSDVGGAEHGQQFNLGGHGDVEGDSLGAQIASDSRYKAPEIEL